MSHIKCRTTRHIFEFESLIRDSFEEEKSINANNNTGLKLPTYKEWKTQQIGDHNYKDCRIQKQNPD